MGKMANFQIEVENAQREGLTMYLFYTAYDIHPQAFATEREAFEYANGCTDGPTVVGRVEPDGRISHFSLCLERWVPGEPISETTIL